MLALSSDYWSALKQLAEKIALELVYTEAGKDNGLLPINSLLGDMEEIPAHSPLLSPFPQALARARALVDRRRTYLCKNSTTT